MVPVLEGGGDAVEPVVASESQIFRAAQLNGSVLLEATMYKVDAEIPADGLRLNESPDQNSAFPPLLERRLVCQDAAQKT